MSGSHTYKDALSFPVTVELFQGWGDQYAAAVAIFTAALGPDAAVPVQVTTVVDSNGYAIKDDVTGKQYQYQWQTAQPTHPYAYVSGSTLNVQATFTATGKTPPSIMIRAVVKCVDLEGPGGNSFVTQLPALRVNKQKGSFSYSGAVAKAFLKNLATTYDVTIFWQASLTGLGWTNVGTTSNDIYLLYTKPANIPLYQTVVWYGCDTEGTTQAKVLKNIWSHFSGSQVTRSDGQPLQYGVNWPATTSTVQTLLATKTGLCDAFSRLFLMALEAQGIAGTQASRLDAKIVEIIPKVGTGLLVKNWNFVGNGPMFINYFRSLPTLFHQVNGQWEYQWLSPPAAAAPPVTYKGSIGAQNNEHARGSFTVHYVVQIGGELYDPSYGETYANLRAFQDTSLDGIYTSTELPNKAWMFIVRRVQKGAKLQVTLAAAPSNIGL